MEKECIEVYGTTSDTMHSWYVCVCSELNISEKKVVIVVGDIKNSIYQSHHTLTVPPPSRRVEQRLRGKCNTSLKTVSQYRFLMTITAR